MNTTEFNRRVGSNIRDQRQCLKLTRETVSKEYVAISPTHLSDVERGVRGLSAVMLYNICQGLGMSMDAVVLEKPEEKPEPTDVSAILETFDEKYLPLAVELLKDFAKAILLR